MATAFHQPPPTQRDGARFVAHVVAVPRREGTPAQRLAALEAHLADVELRLDRLEGLR